MDLISQILTHLLAAGAGAFIALTIAEMNEIKRLVLRALGETESEQT